MKACLNKLPGIELPYEQNNVFHGLCFLHSDFSCMFVCHPICSENGQLYKKIMSLSTVDLLKRYQGYFPPDTGNCQPLSTFTCMVQALCVPFKEERKLELGLLSLFFLKICHRALILFAVPAPVP